MATATKEKKGKAVKDKTKSTKPKKVKTANRKAGEVICEMLLKGATLDEMWETMQSAFAETTAGKERKSCQQQVAWYRSQLRTGKLYYDMDKGELVNLKSKKSTGHAREGKDNFLMK